MWKKVGFQPVGGLREVGFIENTEFLMVLGNQGRTIFNCLTNEKIARDRQDYYSENWDDETGIISGFDLFEGKDIICGGFEYPDSLDKQTKDGWTITIKVEKRLDYKKEKKKAEVMYLSKRESNLLLEVGVFFYSITRAYGFSRNETCFVIAESHGITIWKKND